MPISKTFVVKTYERREKSLADGLKRTQTTVQRLRCKPANAKRMKQGRKTLVEQVQFFAWLEANSAAGSDRHFSPGPGIAPDAGFARFHAEDAKSTQLDAIAGGESILHAHEDGIDSSLGLDARKAGAFGNFMYHVLFDQVNDSLQTVGCSPSCVTPC